VKPRILVTGGTGFLGGEVVPRLRKHFEVDLLSRKPGAAIHGDLTKWDGEVAIESLKGRYQGMLHMAGLYDLRAKHEDLMRTNVLGTHQALTIANKANIPAFVNISTVAVTINLNKHMALADDIDAFAAYPDSYSRSKALAESQVRLWSQTPHRRLNLRLGALVANQNGDSILRVDGPYHFMPILKRLKPLLRNWPGPLLLPRSFKNALPILPVDIAAEAIVHLTQIHLRDIDASAPSYQSLHLAPDQGPTGKDLIESLFRFNNHKMSVQISRNLPAAPFLWFGKHLLRLPEAELVYLTQFPRLDTTDTNAALGTKWCPSFSSYENAMWKGGETCVSNC